MDAIKNKFNSLQPREKKMIYALAGVAVFGAIMLLKPDGKSIEETGMQAVDQLQEITDKREEEIQRLTGGATGGGGSARAAAGGSSSSPEENTSFASHNSENDCWVVFQNTIYDITKMLPDYPGGPERIIQYCGTTKFEENFNFEQVMSADEFLSLAEEKGTYTG